MPSLTDAPVSPPAQAAAAEGELPATTSQPSADAGRGAWAVAVAPIVNWCRVATTFHGQAVFDVDGAAALGELLTNMAELLDEAVGREALSQEKALTPAADPGDADDAGR